MDDGLFEVSGACGCGGNRLCPKCYPPALPYAGTSGWSGSDTSRARAVSADTGGVTGARQYQVLRLLDEAGPRGLTWTEAAEALGVHHGSATGALSVLHKSGLIARLREARDGCKVYVALGAVDGRQTEQQGGRQRACSQCGHIE